MDGDPNDVLRLVGLQLGLDQLQPHQRIVEDLGAESMDIVNIVDAVETHFGIRLSEEELPGIATLADLIALVAHHLEQS